MFCRFCGAHIPQDSLFCARCGKRLAGEDTSAPNRLARRLGLKTPYPWAALLFVLFGTWAVWPEPPGPDLTDLEFALELQAESSVSEGGLTRHYLSLVVTNGGLDPVRDIPVELHAAVFPEQPAEIIAEFRGGRFAVLRDGEVLPIVLVLTDEIATGEKRRFPIDSLVTTPSPAEVTYSIVVEGSGEVLATLSTPTGEGAGAGPLARGIR